jgi:hypothetical protein
MAPSLFVSSLKRSAPGFCLEQKVTPTSLLVCKRKRAACKSFFQRRSTMCSLAAQGVRMHHGDATEFTWLFRISIDERCSATPGGGAARRKLVIAACGQA